METASETARNYCLIEDDLFLLPSRDDLVEHRVVVTTLSTSKVLLGLQVFHGFFTHILIDEAAQALEPEALTPLVFAGPNTKVVFTGDHMQVLYYTRGVKRWIIKQYSVIVARLRKRSAVLASSTGNCVH